MRTYESIIKTGLKGNIANALLELDELLHVILDFSDGN